MRLTASPFYYGGDRFIILLLFTSILAVAKVILFNGVVARYLKLSWVSVYNLVDASWLFEGLTTFVIFYVFIFRGVEPFVNSN